MDLNGLTALWDEHVRDWMRGREAASDERLRRWQETYSGEGN